jgi:S1/P1 Nuclease
MARTCGATAVIPDLTHSWILPHGPTTNAAFVPTRQDGTSLTFHAERPKGDIAQYCPHAEGCVTSAITDQLAVLRNTSASAQARVDALRYVIHFVGDLHQPLHTTTNDDRGGNCVPVAFFDHAPVETNPVKEDYKPNLHGVWDTDIIEHYAHGRTAQQVADELEGKFKAQIPVWKSQPVDIAAWAWEGHEVAETRHLRRSPEQDCYREAARGQYVRG